MECPPRRPFSALFSAALTARRAGRLCPSQNGWQAAWQTPLKRHGVALLSTVLAITAMAFPLQAAAQVGIGVSLPLSGPVEKLGRDFLDGARLKLAEYNKQMGQQPEQQVELVIADDRCDGEVAKLSADELRQSGVGLITGILCNAVAFQLAETLKESAIPLLVAGARAPRLTMDRERKGWHLWRLAPADTEAATIASRELARQWASAPYAIIDDGTAYGRGLADQFRIAMEEAGLPPQFQDNFRPTQSTQARLVRRLRRAGTPKVFVGADAEDAAMIARNAAELEIPLEIVAGDTLSVLPFLPPDQHPPDGLLAVLARHEVDSAVPRELVARFRQAGIDPEPYALSGYRAMEVALEALRPETGETAAQLAGETFETALGPVKFDETGANTVPVHAFFEWRNGAFEEIAPGKITP